MKGFDVQLLSNSFCSLSNASKSKVKLMVFRPTLFKVAKKTAIQIVNRRLAKTAFKNTTKL
jgi:hypothetical protein|tara:strand:- start:1478 stop:1660 length:183 start_codon:yes stop_codon:yes gene_type:complete